MKKSKIPRLISQKTQSSKKQDKFDAKCSREPKSKNAYLQVFQEKSPKKKAKKKNPWSDSEKDEDSMGSDLSEMETNDVVVASRQATTKQTADVDFQEDKKALESILTNKGVSNDLLTPGRYTMQHTPRISLDLLSQQPSYSRLSLMDRQNLFKEKMKNFKDQMKALNIEYGATETRSASKTHTNTIAAAYRNKLFENRAAMSERKEKKCFNLKENFHNRHMPSTLDSCYNSKKGYQSSLQQTRNENKSCRFKLFSSPIVEVSEKNERPSVETKHDLQSLWFSAEKLKCKDFPDKNFPERVKVALLPLSEMQSENIPTITLHQQVTKSASRGENPLTHSATPTQFSASSGHEGRLHQPPERTPVLVTHSTSTPSSNSRAPFLCSYVKKRLDL